MKRTLTFLTLILGLILSGAMVLALAQTNATQQSQAQQAQKPAAASCPMMSKGMRGGMMQQMGEMSCPMMKDKSAMAGQCVQMMLGDKERRQAIVETLKQNPQLREQLKGLLQEADSR